MHSGLHSRRAAVLLPTLVFLTAMTLVAYTLYNRSLQTYKLSQRNEYLARARLVAISELEHIFFEIKTQVIGNGASPTNVASLLSGICDVPASPTVPGGIIVPTTERQPFAVTHRNAADGWRIKRSISYDTPASGFIPNTSKKGLSYYYTVKIQVYSTTSPMRVEVRVGRRMNISTSSVFQYNVFAQGDLEFAPGGTTTIDGDIAANGSVYIGARSGGTMQVNSYLRYLAGKNYSPGKLASGTLIAAPQFGASEAEQVSQLSEPENFVGGLDAESIALNYGVHYTTNANYSGLFGEISSNPTQDATAFQNEKKRATNNVYRSLIAPPPSAAYAASQQGSNGNSYQAEYPAVSSASALQSLTDDPSISALRAYNRAGLILTVNGDGSMTFTRGATSNTIDASSFNGVATNKTMYDMREQRNITVTEVDVGALKTKITANYPEFLDNANGLLYVYLANSNSSSPAAVRLVNAAATPGYEASKGFSVATNGGLYIKGNYNTVQSNGVYNPSMLMADAVTILSDTWSDAVVTQQTGDSSAQVAVKHDPSATINLPSRTANGANPSATTTVAAGILTGNITENSTGYIYSGGGQNLVRFLENWDQGTVEFKGAIGRLFESTHFIRPFIAPTDSPIYLVPGERRFTFNSALKDQRPPGAPDVRTFSRGTFFDW